MAKKFFIFGLFMALLFPVLVSAEEDSNKPVKFPNLSNVNTVLENTGGSQGIGVDLEQATATNAVPRVVGLAINTAISLAGIIAVFFVLYAGWLWGTAAGNEEKITQAKSIMQNAVIALVIILSAWLIFITLFELLAFGDSYV
ncbi:hypothetical protein HY933_04315 [Candidatus Falkowbacteria bacterium]|nr:hypothetical protein [Candidatus Falkowbacteria bacterium]